MTGHAMYSTRLKRAFDVLVSALTLVVLAPVLAALALLVRWRLGSPLLFKQRRAGHHGVPFTLYKFRSMTDERDGHGNLLSDEKRLTDLGRFLRATSLDEIPELVNVLVGDMSLVGPRPLLVPYLKRYNSDQARRHEVRPGITGWAQVNGRNTISWEERFKLDVWYVDHCSFWLDVKILWLTVHKVLSREGITPSDQAQMPDFMGSEGHP
jgi:sugar transferase EpsL